MDRVESGLPRRESFPTAASGGNETPRSNERKARVSTVTGTSGGSAQNTIEQDLQNEEDREKAAQKIGEELKLHYLRTQRPGRIVHLLNSPEERVRKEMWFDFGPPRTFTRGNFRRHFAHLHFDSVLQYVAFPRVQLETKKDEISDTRQKSRADMTFFFNWLKEKGVKRILTVIVDDLEPPFHSDEAIEEALESFDVEILDWRRPDLDPVTLDRVGKCLRKVYLQWSGRNTVLRAWSESDGLARIRTLESIHINQLEDLESEKRNQENINKFEERLREAWPSGLRPPQVIRPKSSANNFTYGAFQLSVQLGHNTERTIDPHKWMECMGDFASYFRQIPVLREPVTDQSLGPVQIALIDDGADITHDALRGFRFPGHSFCHYWEGSTWRVMPYWHSSSGHGTAMAMLIHHVYDKAIKYAIEQGVHVMCMSWTMKPPLEDSVKDEFEDEIIKAGKKGILMFCAASDQGKTADRTWPHSIGTKSFRIGAAKATGATASNVGDADLLSFTLPGHEGTIESVLGTSHRKLEGHSGSSVANALATGLAALIIECVRLGVFHTNRTAQHDPTVAIRKEDLLEIRKRENMDRALKSIGTNRNTEHKYIEVWQTFSDAAEKLKHQGDPISQLDIIAGLARKFLRKDG
ncbi:subtilisin-like protein [Colletotrichum eremochloae]|nr:subtilisin-like protein [Colletotrichum eremochloae]